MNIRFTTEETIRRADEILDHLRGPRLWIGSSDYPDLDAWVERAHAQLRAEDKRAVVALSAGSLVGAVVYQPHRLEPRVLEIKNISVRPDARGRYVASFLVRNAELEGAADHDAERVVVDTKATNHAMVAFLLRAGYRILDARDLYGLGAGVDLMLCKDLRALRTPLETTGS